MSNDAPRTLGTLADWELVTTNSPEIDPVPTSEHDYTIADLYLLLKQVKDLFNPEHMEYVEGLITKHINDFNNPHRTDLTKMNSSVLQELYNLWLAEGNAGTREEFLKILFQYVKIADVFTTLEGTAQDQVPSVKGVTAVVTRHNDDALAHENIFAEFFPGEPLTYPPTFTLDAFLEVPQSVAVVRAGNLSYIDRTGKLSVAPADTLPADYTFGEAMFPLFGALDNKILYSENLTQAYWQKVNGTISVSDHILTPRRDTFAYTFTESLTVNPVEHILKPNTSIAVAIGEVWAVTLFVEPDGRPCFGIRVPEDVAGPYPYVHFDLENETYFINDGADKTCLAARMVKLSSGMTRICLLFKAKIATSFIPEFYPLDILSGDANYVGTGELGTAIFGIQVTKCPELPPYIPSNGTAGTLAKTTVEINLNPWYVTDRGTLVFELMNVIPLNMLAAKELYAIGNGSTAYALGGRFPATHNNRFYFVGYNAANSNIITKWATACTKDKITLVHGFSSTKHRFGFTDGDPIEASVAQSINPNPTKLYLGTDRFGSTPFNGWVKRIMFYPNLCSMGNINFFLGE